MAMDRSPTTTVGIEYFCTGHRSCLQPQAQSSHCCRFSLCFTLGILATHVSTKFPLLYPTIFTHFLSLPSLWTHGSGPVLREGGCKEPCPLPCLTPFYLPSMLSLSHEQRVSIHSLYYPLLPVVVYYYLLFSFLSFPFLPDCSLSVPY